MEFIKTMICFLMALSLQISQASLIVEEETDSKNDQVQTTHNQGQDHSVDSIQSFTTEEREKLLKILGKHFKTSANGNFDKIADSLNEFLQSSLNAGKEISPPRSEGWNSNSQTSSGWNSQPQTSSDGWNSNPSSQCKAVGSSCSSSSRSSEIKIEESEDSKNSGWGSGWGSNGWVNNKEKCCNHDLCQHGKCCVPTPSKRGNSYCRKNEDCCDGGLCDRGRCFRPRGTTCTKSWECYKSECVDGLCCINGCSGGSSSSTLYDTKCTQASDCCGSAKANSKVVCDLTTSQCKSNLGGSCNSTSCPSPCLGTLTCGSSNTCCVPDTMGPCTLNSDCCHQSTGSTCRASGKCQISSVKGCRSFVFAGNDF